MNNSRRKEITAAIKGAEELKTLYDELREKFDYFKSQADELKSTVDFIRDEEEEYKNNIPENLQQSENYYSSDAAGDKLQEAIDVLDAIESLDLEELDLDEIVTHLDEAKA